MGRGPAALLVDSDGNVLGVVQDGTTYRLQVEALVTGPGGVSAGIENTGTREGLAVSYPEMLAVLGRISAQLDLVLQHLHTITGEEEPL